MTWKAESLAAPGPVAGGPVRAVPAPSPGPFGPLTSNLRLVDAPGNVLVPKAMSGLPKDSVVNVCQLVTLDRDYLTERTGKLPARMLAAVDAGLKLVLDLP